MLRSWSIQGPPGVPGYVQIPKGGSVALPLSLPKGRYFVSAKAGLQTDNVKCKLLRVGCG